MSEFVSLLFNDAVNDSNRIESNDCIIENNELERTWKEAAMSLRKVSILIFTST